MGNNEAAKYLLLKLTSAFPSVELKEVGVAMYLELLQDIPLDELEMVVKQCVSECKFLPTIAEIRDRWHNLNSTIGLLSSAEAWGLVLSEIRRIGSWGSPKFDEQPLAAQVVKAIGWMELCASENQMADRAHFMKMYDQIATRQQSVRKLLPQAREFVESRGLLPVGNTAQDYVKKLAAAKVILTGGSE